MTDTSPARPHRYEVYGLTIASDLELPELRPATEAQPIERDVTIEFGAIGDPDPGRLKQLGRRAWAGEGELWLDIPGIARFHVTEGRRIVVQPATTTDHDGIRTYLLGSALGALMIQRRNLVIHGNAVRIGDRIMVCVGPSGAGKSTLAAAFHLRGFDVLADDVVVIDDDGAAIPGYPRIKLWQNTADHFAIDTANLRSVGLGFNKFSLPVTDGRASHPAPVRWIYRLSSHEADGFLVEPAGGATAFKLLAENTYRMHFVRGMKLTGLHLGQCGRLAARIRAARIARPATGFRIDELVDTLLADMRDNP